MENTKYILTDKNIEVFGIKLFQIKSLKAFGNVTKGELGGYIEKEENLDVSGNAWVYDDAWVSGNARVYGDAWVYDELKLEIGFYFGMKFKGQKIKEIMVEDENYLIWKE